MNLPNKLTILRVIMIPFFLVALMVDDIPGGKWIALALFCLASLTDLLDVVYQRKESRYRIKLNDFDEYKKHSDIIKRCVSASRDYYNL